MNASEESTAEDKLMTLPQVCQALQVSDATLRRWMKRGLVAYVLSPSGRRRIARSEVERLRETMRVEARGADEAESEEHA